jgi:hypothetical protein
MTERLSGFATIGEQRWANEFVTCLWILSSEDPDEFRARAREWRSSFDLLRRAIREDRRSKVPKPALVAALAELQALACEGRTDWDMDTASRRAALCRQVEALASKVSR